MDREQLIRRVDSGWREFAAACEGLSAEDLLAPGEVGQWSVKDLKAHVATWEQESLSALRLIEQGERLPRYSRFGGIDAFNHMKWKDFQSRSLEDVNARLVRAHKELLSFLTRAEEHHYARETRFRRRLRLDTCGHLPEHTRQIVAW